MLAGIDDLKLDSTASHPSSSFHSLPRRVDCHTGHPAPTIMGRLVLRLQCTCFVYFYCWSTVYFGFGYNWTSVTAPLSATAETRKKLVAVGF